MKKCLFCRKYAFEFKHFQDRFYFEIIKIVACFLMKATTTKKRKIKTEGINFFNIPI